MEYIRLAKKLCAQHFEKRYEFGIVAKPGGKHISGKIACMCIVVFPPKKIVAIVPHKVKKKLLQKGEER